MKNKHAGGRPPKFKTKEEIQEKIDKYFSSCFSPILNRNCEIVRDDKGKPILQQTRPFTITGLADALDMSRQCLLNYEGKKEFFDTIMRAKRKCELYTEERLFDKDGVNGAKFSLANNYDNWKEKQEVDLETDKPFNVNIKVVD